MKESYISASAFPIKVLLNDVLKDGKIKPYHVQLYPTNLCNLNCSFCSCANRNKSDVLPFDDIISIMNKYKELGCKAVTLSGGGEPLLHPSIKSILAFLDGSKISIGIATNGLSFDKINTELLNTSTTWCRISHSDDRDWNNEYKNKLINIIKECPDVDWSFSYVLTKYANLEMLTDLIDFSNKNNFTHVRIVSDLLDLGSIVDMTTIKEYLQSQNVDDSIVIYQGRKEFSKGTKKCLISLLKPVINADGNIYPCCGVQYLTKNPTRDCNSKISMGNTVKDLERIYLEQDYFDGSICYRCYYSEYNTLLGMLTQGIEHKEFV